MNDEDIISEIDKLLQIVIYDEPNWSTKSGLYYESPKDAELFSMFQVGSLSLLRNIFGENHTYYKEFSEKVKLETQYVNSRNAHPIGQGILRMAKQDIENGGLQSLKSLVSADIFSDFLEMAEYLLSQGYHDAAAVIIGSVLEEHLRQLCSKNSIPVETERDGTMKAKRAEMLNTELAGKSVYNKNVQKSVTAWLGLRNSAAHGKYSEYTKEQIVIMLQSVQDFINRNPA